MKVECKKCGALNGVNDDACWKCKTHISDEEKQAAISAHEKQIQMEDIETEKNRASTEAMERSILEDARQSGDWERVPDSLINRKAESIVITTSYFIAGKDIEREIDIITAECVYGMHIFRDLFAAVRDIFGGRNKATQKVLRDARNVVLMELRKEALMVGADAVVAVDLDYQEFSGYKDGSMLMIVASGTAVRLK